MTAIPNEWAYTKAPDLPSPTKSTNGGEGKMIGSMSHDSLQATNNKLHPEQGNSK